MIRRGALALACAVALAACSPPSHEVSDSARPTAASDRVTQPDAVVAFPRTLQAARLVEAQVRTEADVDAVVIAARLDSPLFADSEQRESDVRLFPDWANRVRLPLGEPVCPAPDGDSTVVLTIRVAGAETTEILAVPDDAKLREINVEECAERAVLDIATPSFGPIESQDASELHTTIVLTRGDSKADQPVTLASMTGNIVYIVTLDDTALRTLAPGAESIAVPAVVSVGRCDPHVFAESKKTFVFPVRLAVGDAEPAYVEIQPDPTARAALQQLFEDCGEEQRGG